MSAFRPRLLPLVIVGAFLLLGLKIGDLWSGEGATAIAVAWAQAGSATEKPAEPQVEKPQAESPQDATGAKTPEKTADKPAETPSPNAVAPADATAAAQTTPKAAPAAGSSTSGPSTSGTTAQAKTAARDPLLMSPAEIDVLQHLSERRAELDKRAAGLRDQEVLMQAAEKRIEERIAKLQALEQSIDGSAQKQDDEDDARVKSLVHIYEAMKPGEAARIFEQLEMPVLLSVVEHMRETKAALVLAAMDPTKAKTVTMALADRRAQMQAQGQVPAAGGAKPSAQASAQPASATR